MSRYRVYETDTFQEDLAKIRESGSSRIEEKLREHVYPQLRTEPHYGQNVKRLKNWDPPTWRYRIGAWRFFYEFAESNKKVYMTTADHRSRSYR